MKTEFKETRFGKLIDKVKNVGLDVAPIIAKVGTGNISGAISDTISLLNGSDNSEAKELLDELTIRKKEIELDYYRVMSENVTERWSSDMVSDSWLSKNVRPLTLAWLIVSVTAICILDSVNALNVDEMWVSLFSNILMTVIVAYFGSRGIEKYKKIK